MDKSVECHGKDGKIIQKTQLRIGIKNAIDKLSNEELLQVAKRLGEENNIDNSNINNKRELCEEILKRKVVLKGSENLAERISVYMDGLYGNVGLLNEAVQQLNQDALSFTNFKKEQEEKKDTPSSETHPLYEYDMTHIPRGTCIIINNTFDHDPRSLRKGTNVDRDRLKRVFEWLQFEVDVRNNMEADDICRLFDNLDDNILEHSDCFVCCILSHGGPLDIYGNDGKPVSRKKLRMSVHASSCKKLANKPKVFFIQACRKDLGQEGSGDAQPAYADSRAPAADICVVAATTEDTLAYRGEESGSLFIQKVCSVLEGYAHEDCFNTMMMRVTNALCEKKICYSNESSGETIIDHQVPDLTMATLCGKLHFNPGISFKDYCKEQNIDHQYFHG